MPRLTKQDTAQPEQQTGIQTPEQARQAAMDLLVDAGLEYDVHRFMCCCRPINPRWEGQTGGRFEYWGRLHRSAAAWLAMTEVERDIIAAGVDDGTYWRGEDVQTFARFCDEEARMEKDPQAYIARARSMLDGAKK